MTALDFIRHLTDDTITAAQASAVLRCDPNSLRRAARDSPERLGFPVILIGHTVRIPRIPFLMYVTGGSYAEANAGAGGTG
jgi:hypothetical protein